MQRGIRVLSDAAVPGPPKEDRIMFKVVSAAFLSVLLLVPGLSEAADAAAGSVDRLKGTATASKGSFSRPLFVGAEVFVGDRVATGADTRIRIKMADGAAITLGDNSSLTIEAFDDDKTVGKAALNLAEGVFLATSGAIAQLGPDRMSVTTPTAVLGIRGTTVWGEQRADQLGVVLLEGTAVEVRTAQGAVLLNEVNAGTDCVAGTAPSRPKPWGAARLAASAAKVTFE